MAFFRIFTLLICWYTNFVFDVKALTMDQLIINAAESSQQFDFFYDMGDGTMLVELDMKFTAEGWKELQRLNSSDFESIRKKRKAVRSLGLRWTDKTIPYEIAPNTFSDRDMTQIRAAIADWETYTCIKFRQARSSDTNRIRFQNGAGCSSYVGMVGRTQSVSLAPGCRSKGIIIHEVGHAVGFHHEQTRPDRDRFVKIIRENIPANLFYNFQKYTNAVINTHGVPYDYRSVMHYGERAFSINNRRTIVTTDPAFQSVIGNRAGHSFNDIKLANLMYTCDDSCGRKTCTGNAFVGQDCKCWCPGNPVKLCDGGEIGGGTGNGGNTGGGSAGGGTTDGGNTGNGGCVNMNKNCDSWASVGECDKNPGYMKMYCKKACNVCKTVSSCEDMNVNCEYWKNQGFCTQRFVAYMATNCAKSCDACQSDEFVSLQGTGTNQRDNLSVWSILAIVGAIVLG